MRKVFLLMTTALFSFEAWKEKGNEESIFADDDGAVLL